MRWPAQSTAELMRSSIHGQAALQVPAIHCGAGGYHQAGALPADLLHRRICGWATRAARALQVPLQASAPRAGTCTGHPFLARVAVIGELDLPHAS